MSTVVFYGNFKLNDVLSDGFSITSVFKTFDLSKSYTFAWLSDDNNVYAFETSFTKKVISQFLATRDPSIYAVARLTGKFPIKAIPSVQKSKSWLNMKPDIIVNESIHNLIHSSCSMLASMVLDVTYDNKSYQIRPTPVWDDSTEDRSFRVIDNSPSFNPTPYSDYNSKNVSKSVKDFPFLNDPVVWVEVQVMCDSASNIKGAIRTIHAQGRVMKTALKTK